MRDYVEALGTPEGYSGYGPEDGWQSLKEKISEVWYRGAIPPEWITLNDGIGSDLGRLQILFGNCSVALQDPAYPAYMDLSRMMGREIRLLPCTPENDFFPDHFPKTDLIYWCSPNNPTGVASTREQLEQLIQIAKANKSIILFDAAYTAFSSIRSIYEIPGATEVAIELGSFSKWAGFTGVRLGWTVVPPTLGYKEWYRLLTTSFNGPSNIAQIGGLACLTSGWEEVQGQVQHYLKSAAKLRQMLSGHEIYGGTESPYVWLRVPGRKSWDLFDDLLHNGHIVTTPGAGYGPSGEGFVRLSGFAPIPSEIASLLMAPLRKISQ